MTGLFVLLRDTVELEHARRSGTLLLMAAVALVEGLMVYASRYGEPLEKTSGPRTPNEVLVMSVWKCLVDTLYEDVTQK